jgi:hypothetical protein
VLKGDLESLPNFLESGSKASELFGIRFQGFLLLILAFPQAIAYRFLTLKKEGETEQRVTQ